MPFEPNKLFHEMVQIFSNNYSSEKQVVICNEGGSRSSKTWDAFHFIYAFCDHNKGKGNDIYILRETLVKCRDFTFKDFKKCMGVIGAPATYFSEKSKPEVNLFGNNIYFRGLESEDNSEGYPSDIIFVNESLETQKNTVDGLIMRCRKLVIMDWNPKYTEHWCFDLEKQDNVFFTRSDYTNNKHLEKSVVKRLESYNPFEDGSTYVEDNKLMYEGLEVGDRNKPPPHIFNIEQGTSDLFRYKVYTLGLRGAMKGLIFNNIKYIEEFPDLAITFGLDFGFTNDPTALVKYAQEGNNIYLELLTYEPIDQEEILVGLLEALDVPKLTPITADSSDKYISENRGVVEMVTGIRKAGYSCDKVSKTQSVMYWLSRMKNYKIHIVQKNCYTFAKIEAENYRFKEINGISINQPEDKFNHFWDASRYAFMSYNNVVVWE